MPETDKKSQFWNSFIRSVEAEPRDAKSLRGASGLIHPIVALGVDEARRRVVIISGESDARYAAMAHADIQAAMPSIKAVMARPVAVNLAEVARALSKVIGKRTIGPDEFRLMDEHSEEFQEIVKRVTEEFGSRMAKATFRPFTFASLNLIAVLKEIIQQLFLIKVEWSKVIDSEDDENDDSIQQMPTFGLTPLISLDPVEVDRRVGVCPIPLYDFSEDEVEPFHSGTDTERVREILKSHDVLQYFFPAADHLALGLAEQASPTASELVNQLLYAPQVGHPFGKSEIVPAEVALTNLDGSLANIIDSLQERKFLVEGEAGLEITPEGTSIRSTVRYKPRESFLSKLSRIISFKIDVSLKDLLQRGP